MSTGDPGLKVGLVLARAFAAALGAVFGVDDDALDPGGRKPEVRVALEDSAAPVAAALAAADWLLLGSMIERATCSCVGEERVNVIYRLCGLLLYVLPT